LPNCESSDSVAIPALQMVRPETRPCPIPKNMCEDRPRPQIAMHKSSKGDRNVLFPVQALNRFCTGKLHESICEESSKNRPARNGTNFVHSLKDAELVETAQRA